MSRRLVRPREGRMIAGVCAGLAQRFGWSAGFVRLLFILSLLLPGTQVIIYVVLWILMPNEGRREATRPRRVRPRRRGLTGWRT
ncbi:PspC domain-containing protein [Micromonospora sp. WMMA1363]|uniref:PspC domain-containing protein n=1 Tax=Micromonospora sp. WMMA1363 TaxID=3053985 RepID=UPI00259CABC4|nr:PspC domain-containing protein [Micromonospora sp. WMMA1363]MDM4722242.1 PspC domain-containing protein [Micromonospora sp. WMMA1363]